MNIRTHYKYFCDTIHGFIPIPDGLILKIIDHPWVQRLRYIRQLGCVHLVYPNAEHSRFSHVLGTVYLMQRALNELRYKNVDITDEEYQSMLITALLHDIGHGPFSHSLEYVWFPNLSHEQISLFLIQKMNRLFCGKLSTAITIFEKQYTKPFFHQLTASQLDVDRLDYLLRDSIFTGVHEGNIGVERILKTLCVVDNKLAVEHKGIYALENYLTSRRLMYQQVYLHKTVLSIDFLLKSIFERVRRKIQQGADIYSPSSSIDYFLKLKDINIKVMNDEVIEHYTTLLDGDIMMCIKAWHEQKQDLLLAELSRRYLNRDLFKTEFLESSQNPDEKYEEIRCNTLKWLRKQKFYTQDEDVDFFVYHGQRPISPYEEDDQNAIYILKNNTKLIWRDFVKNTPLEMTTHPFNICYVLYPKL